MPRIRTIKPEFWEDEVIGCLSRDARLLFIATWNLADDEGLLRWSAAYMKSSAFIYDDIDLPEVEKLMAALVEAGLVYAYQAGKSRQTFAYVVNFHKHQKINRPTPSRLFPPPLQDAPTKQMYAKRDGWRCHLCGGEIEKETTQETIDFSISMDHLTPVSSGGSDFPTNIRSAHITCNKGRGSRSVEEYQKLLRKGRTAAQFRYPERFTEPLSESITDTLSAPALREVEKEEEHGSGRGKERECAAASAAPVITLPLNDGSEHPVTKPQVEEWGKLYPVANVEQELRGMRGWLSATPQRRKTKTGINKFINAWLARVQNQGRPSNVGVNGTSHNRANENAQKGIDEIRRATAALARRTPAADG